MKKGKGLRFGYYSNSLNFLDLLSFQTTLVIGAKINKMCCTAKENTCFFLIRQTFRLSFQRFNCLAEILLVFGRNKLCPLFVNFAIGHNPSLSLVWPTKRGREKSVERVSANLLPATFLYVGHTSKVWISARQFFSALLFRYFPFLGSGCKSRIVCRRRSRSYSGGDKSLTRLSPTPPTYLTKPQEKYTPAERQTSYLSFPVFVFLGGFYMHRFITRFSIYLIIWHAIRFSIFIRICLFAIYLHLDAVFTVSHPLVVPVQSQR